MQIFCWRVASPPFAAKMWLGYSKEEKPIPNDWDGMELLFYSILKYFINPKHLNADRHYVAASQIGALARRRSRDSH